MLEIAALEPTTLSILVAGVAIFLFSPIIHRIFFHKPLRLPPGPHPLPVVGNFLHLIFFGEENNIIGKWMQNYGPIVTIWLGKKCIIVVSDADVAEEALIGLSDKLASRSIGSFAMKHFISIGFRMISTSPHGAFWRSVRRNLASHVLTKGARTALQPIREEEFGRLVEALGAEAKEGEAGVTLRQHLRLTSCAIFFRVCFGKRGDKATLEDLNKTLDVLFKELGYQLGDFFPFLAPFLVHKQKKRRERIVDKLDNVFGPLVEEQRELRKAGHTAQQTYVDNILALQDEMGLSHNDVLALLAELHFAGIDTNTVATEWTLGELTANLHVQEKLFQEIIRVVGKRPVTEDDIANLPYLKAVVQESFRRHPPVPSLIGHAPTSAGVKLAGYDIPEYAIVLISAKKIQNDPREWSEPEKFDPERFLDSDGHFVDEMAPSRSGKMSKIIPFGAGRRICPGMSTGLTIVHFLVARLVQAFEFSPVDPEKGVDFTEAGAGMIITLFKTPLRVFLRDRWTRDSGDLISNSRS